MSSKFSLSEKFLAKYEGKQPNWGFGDLSYFVYYRTYSRLMPNGQREEWFDTVKRVVEGCFSIQHNHCETHGLFWDAHKAQRSAQKMFEKIWEFKFTPPGRGLWMMGTEALEKKGSACLFNCAAVSTADIKKDFSEPFAWSADMLMLGVGVGYDLDGAGTRQVIRPTGTPTTYIIPDTREGWVESVRLLIDSYDGSQKATPIEFDYSQIRPIGEPIKTFGGVASGPGPLIEGHKNIRAILDNRHGQDITSVDIVDMMNFIGKFVVSGSVRRSAEIALGNLNDYNFLDMKNPDKYGIELMDRRWVSNNSVRANKDSDFNKVAENICINGEPGLIFTENISKYGRIRDGEHLPYKGGWDAASLVNPCIPARSKFLTRDNGIIPLSELVVGQEVWTGIKWAKITKVWSTGVKPVYRYKTSRGYTIDCTRDHKLLTTEGKVEAQHAEDILICPNTEDRQGIVEEYEKALLAGLVQGDGSKQKNGGRCAYLYVGTKDKSSYAKLGLNNYTHSIDNIDDNRQLWKLDVDFSDLEIDYAPLPSRVISDHWMKADRKTTCAFLKGLYSANGSVINSQRIALKTSCYELAWQVQLLLSSVGINSYITTNKSKDTTFSNGTYTCRESYDVNTSQTDLFMDKIGFIQEYKTLERKGLDKSRKYTEIVSEEYLGDEEVWDFTVDAEEHTAWVNGVIISNCAEICLENMELCNLVEMYPANHDSPEEFYETMKFAYLYCKTVTLIPTHNRKTNAVIMRNRRIGVSQSGIQQAIKKFGHSIYYDKYCNEAYNKLKEYDQSFSRWLGIPTSIRLTTVKPSGTVSILSGSTPGVHYTHSEYYLRTVRISANSNLLPALIKANYRIEIVVTDMDKFRKCATEDELADAKGKEIVNISDLSRGTLKRFAELSGTLVVYFPIKEKNFTKSKAEASIWEQLSHVRELQTNWVDNSVSVTITLTEDDKRDLVSALQFFSPYIKTLSFLPLTDHTYKQAPFTDCTKDEYEVYKESLGVLDFTQAKLEDAKGERYCSNDVCTI